jgi:hypothetical protein
LLPLILPLAVLFGERVFEHKFLLFTWIIFNVILITFYGLFHQGLYDYFKRFIYEFSKYLLFNLVQVE